MGLVTIPMALLSLASLVGGLVLLVSGAWVPVVVGMVAFGVCTLLVPALERLVVAIDDAAIRTLRQRGRGAAMPFAMASGGVPMAVLLCWEFACFAHFSSGYPGDHGIALWMWSYGIATGPWTAFALRVSRFRRTLCGIRAYAGHLAYWLLSILVFGVGLSPAAALPAMLLPAILPTAVGMLLAIADRDALTNVRV
jgi:hypothetical protein